MKIFDDEQKMQNIIENACQIKQFYMQQPDHNSQILRIRKQNIRLRYQLNQCEKKVLQIQQKFNNTHRQNASQTSRIRQQKIMDRICSHIYSSQFGQDVDNKIHYLQHENNLLKKELRRIQRINQVMQNKIGIQRKFFELTIQKIKNERKVQDNQIYFQFLQTMDLFECQIKDLTNQRQEQMKMKNLQKKINNLKVSRKRRDDYHKNTNQKIRNNQLQTKQKSKGSLINKKMKDLVEEDDKGLIYKSPSEQRVSIHFSSPQYWIQKQLKVNQCRNLNIGQKKYDLTQQYTNSLLGSGKQESNEGEKINDPETEINSKQEQLKTSGFFKQLDLDEAGFQGGSPEQQHKPEIILKKLNLKFRKNIKNK